MKRSVIIGLTALILLTALFAVLHLTTRTPEEKGSIRFDGETVFLSELRMTGVKGRVTNGKGETTQIDTDGVPLALYFDGDIVVRAADSYSVTVRAEELEYAYLIPDGDGVRLVVFGDTDAKRNVKNVSEVDPG